MRRGGDGEKKKKNGGGEEEKKGNKAFVFSSRVEEAKICGGCSRVVPAAGWMC